MFFIHRTQPHTFSAQFSCRVTWMGLEKNFWVIKFSPSCLPVILCSSPPKKQVFTNMYFSYSKLFQIQSTLKSSRISPQLLGSGMKERQNNEEWKPDFHGSLWHVLYLDRGGCTVKSGQKSAAPRKQRQRSHIGFTMVLWRTRCGWCKKPGVFCYLSVQLGIHRHWTSCNYLRRHSFLQPGLQRAKQISSSSRLTPA